MGGVLKMRGRICAAIAVISMAAVSSPLIAVQADASDKTSASSHRLNDPSAALRFWTDARMAAAEPLSLPEVDPAEIGASVVASGEPVKITGTSSPSPRTATSTRALAGEVYEGGRIIPFKRFEIDDPTQSPYVMHGQVFGRTSSGIKIGCSGTVVQSENKSVVWTAAHCLYSFGEYRTDFVFAPGYKDGPSSHGTWAATEILVPSQWEATEDTNYDFGALVLAPNDEGALIGDAVGMRGIAFNQSPDEFFQSYGYPAVPQQFFDGERMHSCESQGSGRVFGGLISMGCDMQFGASGGGWIMRGGYLSSNYSGGSPGTYPEIAWGPYLGTAAKNLYDQARGGSGPLPQPTPTAPVGPSQTHRMSVSLKLVHVTTPDGQVLLVAKGRVKAVDGYLNCNLLTPVDVAKYRRSNRTYYPVGEITFANSEGRFATVIPDRPGKYSVSTEQSPYDLKNDCARAFSDPARHLHE